MRITIELTIEKTDGRTVDVEDVAEAVCDNLIGQEFEAGEEDSVFQIQAAEQA